MSGKFLVIEYEETALPAYYNRNNYTENMVSKQIVENNPVEMERTIYKLRGELNGDDCVDIDAKIRNQISGLEADILERDDIIRNLKKQLAHKGAVVHFEGIKCGVIPVLSEYKTTTDYQYITCKRCQKAEDKQRRERERLVRENNRQGPEGIKNDNSISDSNMRIGSLYC